MAIVNVDVGGVVTGLMSGLDSLFTSDKERAEGELFLTKELNKPHILQAMINLKEAEHPSIFVAGWRPALGWLCVILLAYAWIGRDFVVIALALKEKTEIIKMLPAIDADQIMSLVIALLGLGGIRAYEKTKGVARSKL